jgi:hypothetical protein
MQNSRNGANSDYSFGMNGDQLGDFIMAHLSASKLTFAPHWHALSDEDQMAEQVAAFGIVAACGGEVKAQYLLTTDACLFSVIQYQNEDDALKAASAISRRGAFLLEVQRAVTLEEYMGMGDEVQKLAGK